jgi:hypothetical protein
MSEIKKHKELFVELSESVYFRARSSLMFYWLHWLIAGLFIIAAAFFLYPLVQQGVWGIYVDVILAVIGLWIFFRTYVSWYSTCWKITNWRIVDVFQRGFTHQEKTEVSYSQIENIYGKKKGIISGLFGLGDVYISVSGSRVKLKLASCPRYAQLISLINQKREDHVNGVGDRREQKAQLLLLKIKKRLGEEKFNELIFD